MAKTENKPGSKPGNGDSAAAQQPPAIHVLAQYLKDFSFENPKAPASLQNQTEQPKIDVSVNVNAKPMDKNMEDFEIELIIDAKAAIKNDVMFETELVYCGIFKFQNIPEENLQPVVMIEGPRILFPFARQIIADATRNGGFAPLMLDPIDFARLYQDRAVQPQSDA